MNSDGTRGQIETARHPAGSDQVLHALALRDERDPLILECRLRQRQRYRVPGLKHDHEVRRLFPVCPHVVAT